MGLRRLVDIIVFLDKDHGFELRFLNSHQRRTFTIRSAADLEATWQAGDPSCAKPGGSTPLLSTLEPSLARSEGGAERIVMVLTDGCPSDGTFCSVADPAWRQE